jgi:hypothetical protein
VRLDDHPVAYLKLVHRPAHRGDVARVFVTEDELAVGRHLRQAVMNDLQVRASDATGAHPNEDVLVTEGPDGPLADLEVVGRHEDGSLHRGRQCHEWLLSLIARRVNDLAAR